MTEKDIEKMLEECGGFDTSHLNKNDILAKAKQKMYFNADAVEQKKEKSSFPLFFTKKRFVPIIAGAALAFTICIGMVGLYNENFQTVYIDINPSVALKLNRFERVIGVEYLNDDAKALLSDTKLVGCDVKEALQSVITACDSAGYVKSDSEIYISATAKEEQKSEQLLKKLKGHAETMREDKDETFSVNTYNAKKNEEAEFEKESLSPAKYNIIKEIIDEDERYKLEDLKNKPMDQLRKIKRGFEEDDDDREDFEDDEREDKDDLDADRKENEKREEPKNEDDKKLNAENPKEPPEDDDDDDDDEHDNEENKKPKKPE